MMWIGTVAGLNRYDGSSFKIFRHNVSDTASLGDNTILKITEDKKGQLWIITRFGICLYNPELESFQRKMPYEGLPVQPTRSGVVSVLCDPNGNMWITDKVYALFKYEPEKNEIIQIQNINNDPAYSNGSAISNIALGANKSIWLIHRNGIIEQIDIETNKLRYRNEYLNQLFKGKNYDFRIFVDNENDIWASIQDNPSGCFWFNLKTGKVLQLSINSGSSKLLSNFIYDIVQDNKGIVWISTDHGGINLYNKKTNSITYLLNKADDIHSLSQNSVTTLYRDNTGIMWAGTFKQGVNYYHEGVYRFDLIKHQTSDLSSLPYDDVNCFAEDDKGNLYIGTNGNGLLYYDRRSKKFTTYRSNPSSPNGLTSNVIVSLWFDSYKKLWIGTYWGGLNCFDGRTFKQYRNDFNDPQSLSNNCVWEIYEDSHKNLWIGTLGGSLDLLDREKNTFTHYRSGVENSVRSNFIFAMAETPEGDMLFGSADGLDVMNRATGRFTHYETNGKDLLSNNNILCIVRDKRGLVWLGTREGLNLFDYKKHKFRIFREEDGLPDNAVVSMVEDKNGNLWIGTPNGLSNLRVLEKRDKEGKVNYDFTFLNFDESDGLQGKEFNENAAISTRNGELFFGGAGGINAFFPEKIQLNRKTAEVILTDFQVFNKSVHPQEMINGRVILAQSISMVKEIELHYYENVFTLEFASPGFIHPEKNTYLYKLEGFDKEWIKTKSDNRKVTYTNLDPGTYYFKVKVFNNDGIYSDKELSVKIVILPPFWKTKFAYIIYIIIIVLAFTWFIQTLLNRERRKYKIAQERMEIRRERELDAMKLKFFTNISHEFRTPLTLILTPLEKLIKQSSDEEQKRHLNLIYRNAKRLLNLVNQLLDFRKMEFQELKLNVSQGEMISFAKDIVDSFSDLTEKKNIRFMFSTNVEKLETCFDHDKLEKILFNLLSNAFKFTQDQGEIRLDINIETRESKKTAVIKVSDTGIGISPEKHDKVFDRFFQNETPDNLINPGSGIGLALVKEYVMLQGGTVSVESQLGQGSCFTVVLPLDEFSTSNIEISAHPQVVMIAEKEVGIEEDEKASAGKNKPQLLLVEDNEDFRFYLKDNLKGHFQVFEASNGSEGLQKAQKIFPDLIVSDIMMPVMDGLDMCKRLKTDSRTSHIPVVLLTARSTDEQKKEGFDVGADEYMAKPFSFELLESRIKNLIAQRKKLQRSFQSKLEIEPSEISVTPLDEKLMRKALDLVEKNIANPDFSVEELSRELGMSRVHFYKKILSLTGKTPIEFIRVVRLKRAAQLLLKSQLSVSEVSYQVGFNNPKYFARYFRDEFHVLPSQYAADANKGESIDNDEDNIDKQE
jgi:signal transduction histidine kinase/ligand-binding sensor domain-containing protein/DNA-binding response OmpR family regulator